MKNLQLLHFLKLRSISPLCCLILLSCLNVQQVQCFHSYNSHSISNIRTCSCSPLYKSKINNKDEIVDNDKIATPPIDSNLIRPPINIRKESILFSENPSTAANNNISRIWKFMRMNLPYIVTGVSSSSSSSSASSGKEKNDLISAVDKNPIGAIYNVLFVRLPTIFAGLVYSKNLVLGHPLFCDFGAGPFEIPPLVVYGVLLLILR